MRNALARLALPLASPSARSPCLRQASSSGLARACCCQKYQNLVVASLLLYNCSKLTGFVEIRKLFGLRHSHSNPVAADAVITANIVTVVNRGGDLLRN